MTKHDWHKLSHQQLGRYAEYYVKMEFTLHGFDVYGSEVDDRGIDLLVRKSASRYYDIQVKACRNLNYVFMRKDKFELRDNLFLALALFDDQRIPDLYLIPSTAWLTPNTVFVDMNYEGLKSKPEWGLRLSRKSVPLLGEYVFERAVRLL